MDLEELNATDENCSASSRKYEAVEQLLYQFRRLQDVSDRVIAERKIRKILIFYRRYKRSIIRSVLYRIINNELPEMCFQLQIEDSNLVADLLQCIGELNEANSLAPISHFLVNALRHNKNLADLDVWQRERQRLKTFTFLRYFLHHARVTKLKFGGYRLTELIYQTQTEPFFLELHFADPECILSLIQYGTMFISNTTEEQSIVENVLVHCLEFLIFWGVVLRHWHESSLTIMVQPSEFHREIKDMCQIFSIMLRSVSNPYVTTYRMMGADAGLSEPIPQREVLLPFYDSLFPGMEYGRPKPASLHRLCRFVIRQRLNENWQLPDGIWKLGLPSSVCDYINLIQD